MEIKRKIEKVIHTNRRFVISFSQNIEQMPCAECGAEMLPIEKAAAVFGIKQRRIFQIIEKEVGLHFIETETSSVMICLSSLSVILNQDLLSLIAKDE